MFVNELLKFIEFIQYWADTAQSPPHILSSHFSIQQSLNVIRINYKTERIFSLFYSSLLLHSRGGEGKKLSSVMCVKEDSGLIFTESGPCMLLDLFQPVRQVGHP